MNNKNFQDILWIPLSIAPMVDWTNTHFRRLMRLIAPQALVYTEMEAIQAILHRRKKSIYFAEEEHPIALQVGGSDLAGLVAVVKVAQETGFDELNLNMGCPSPKVQQGRFGACLMKEGKQVAECIQAMKQVAQIPVTIKMRIGVDEWDSVDFFLELAGQLINAGVDKLIIHARKAWLKGFSPKENRTLPPLQYDYVYSLKQSFPHLPIMINGQLDTLEVIKGQKDKVDGVMIGRLACRDPYAIAEIHRYFYPDYPVLTLAEVVAHYLDYAYLQANTGVPFSFLCRPLLAMSFGQSQAKQWKHQVMNAAQSRSSERLLELKEHVFW